MTKNVLSALFSAARGLLRHAGALLALSLLYAALIIAAVLFVTTREATVFQVGLTAVLALVVPVLFFLLASSAAAYAVGESQPFGVVRRALRNFLQVFLVSVPLIALVVGTVWAMNKLESRAKLDPQAEANLQSQMHDEDAADEGTDAAPRPKPPVRWAYVFYFALRLFLLGIVLPLLAIHLWIVTVRDGLRAALLQIHRTLARALSARAVFTYAVGMIVFALLPYFLIIKRTPTSAGWLELSLLTVRLFAAFALTLFGFVATTTALARADANPTTDADALAPQPVPPSPRADATASVAS